jgi:menaquinone-dependent protoporphyrinogen IX oxidase
VISLSTLLFNDLFADERPSLSDTNSMDYKLPLKGDSSMKTLLLCVSVHHQNTAKIAGALSRVLNSPVKSPSEVSIGQLSDYDMIGFGSGIYSQKHHTAILNFVDKIPEGMRKNSFIFSTSGISRKFAVKNSVDDPHTVIRNMLQKKNWVIKGEYNCAGWNTNSFLKFFGGMNRGKPDQKDLAEAERFGMELVDL